MGQVYPVIDDRLRAFIEAQHVFFVATAPARDGHVNLSPKGIDLLRVLAPTTVAYADWTGSGVETLAHLRENGRIVIMLCAFEGPPRIVRLHGHGAVLEPEDARFAAVAGGFPRTGIRAVIQVELTRISDSCGFGVPHYRYEGDRPQLPAWVDSKGEAGVKDYQRTHNVSIDGLTGLRRSAAPEA